MNAPPPVTDEAFIKLKQTIIARTGHFYYDDKDDLLWERVRKRLTALRLTPGAYLERLEDPVLGDDEWQALESELTIGETYFFRYPEQFAALRETILPDLIEQRRAERRLRIWSAGCATGAEAYSISILLHDLLGDQLPQWSISILGTDINMQFLRAAREARFGRWALRTLSQAEMAGWFVAEHGQWRLKAQFKSLVRFQRGNLLDLLGPAPPLELVDFDLILCRNVLIYFHPAQVAEIAAALVGRLKIDGWMLVGHAEPNPEFARFTKAAPLPGTVAYRPRNAPTLPSQIAPLAATGAEAWAPLLPPQAPKAIGTRRQEPGGRPVAPERAATPCKDPPEHATSEVRQLADVGDYEGAALRCRAALTDHPEHAPLHFYAGVVAEALGHLRAAEEALRRAIYLDPGFVMARYHLGVVRSAQGRAEAGRKAVAAAAQMAGTLAVDERLPEGAGLTAGELRELARVHMETMGAKDG